MTLRTLVVVVLGLVVVSPAAAAQKPASQKAPPAPSPAVAREIQGLESPEFPRQLEAAFNLGNMGAAAESAVSALIEVLGKGRGLVEIPPEALKYFEKETYVINAGDKAYGLDPLQDVASVALARIGKSAIEPLHKDLLEGNPEESGMYFAGRALAKMAEPSATAVLHGLLRDSKATVGLRRIVAEALGNSADPTSVDALIAALKDSEPRVRSAAAKSLERITKQKLGEDSQKWEAWRAGQPSRVSR